MKKVQVNYKKKKGKILDTWEVEVRKYERHEYDVDLIRNQKELVQIIENSGNILKDETTIKKFKELLMESINYFRELNVIEIKKKKASLFDYYFDHNLPIIVQSHMPPYEMQLAMMLIWFDTNKIGRLLDYQLEQHNTREGDRNDFIGQIEYAIYDLVKRFSPYCGNEKRLEKIMAWVEEKRNQTIRPKSLDNPSKKNKTFLEFLEDIDGIDKMIFAEKLKQAFSGEKGKSIAMMILALDAMRALFIVDKKRKEMYRAIAEYFGHKIGADSTLNEVIHRYKANHNYMQDYSVATTKINTIINNLRKGTPPV